MTTEKNETINEIQTAQKKENWEMPELSELSINETKSSSLALYEDGYLVLGS